MLGSLHPHCATTKQGTYNSQPFAYVVIPYPGGPNPTPQSQGFASNLDELTSTTSHELAEAATDPDLKTGWLETVHKNYNLSLARFSIKLFSVPMTGEEIGDVPLVLYNYAPTCFAMLNGYEIQKQIAPDGTSLLIPDGATDLPVPPPQPSTPRGGVLSRLKLR